MKCNFLIWTPEMSGLLEGLDLPSTRERQLLGGQTTEAYTATIINLREHTDKVIFKTYLDNIASKKDQSVVLDWDLLAQKSGMMPKSPGLRTL